MVNQWRLILIFIHCQSLYKDFILPISANIDHVIVKYYEYVNYIDINVAYKKRF
jgi:hypothetical protein